MLPAKLFKNILGVFLCADYYGHRVYSAVVYDKNSVLFEEVGVAERLKMLECDDYVRLALFNDGLTYRLAEADEGYDASASLSP